MITGEIIKKAGPGSDGGPGYVTVKVFPGSMFDALEVGDQVELKVVLGHSDPEDFDPVPDELK